MGKLDNDKNLEEIADSYLVQKDQRQRTETGTYTGILRTI